MAAQIWVIERIPLFYSLVEAARLVGVEPRAYLTAMAFAAIRGEELLLPHDYAVALTAETDRL